MDPVLVAKMIELAVSGGITMYANYQEQIASGEKTLDEVVIEVDAMIADHVVAKAALDAAIAKATDG
jgi:hypothetical protein